MKFKRGQNIKPSHTTETGQVIFTDGNVNCAPNQSSCEAYGYKWNPTTNICEAFPAQNLGTLMKTTIKLGNAIAGVLNEVKEGSYYNEINGSENHIGRGVQNGIITGKGNDISDYIDEANISGLEGKILRQGEVMQGAGVFDFESPLRLNGYAQASQIQFTGVTSDATPTIMKINGRGDLVLQTNSIVGFEITMTSYLKSGGAYKFYKNSGAIWVNNDGEATICIGEPVEICNGGEFCDSSFVFIQYTTGEGEDTVYGDVQLWITGCEEQEVLHHAVMNINETRTNL